MNVLTRKKKGDYGGEGKLSVSKTGAKKGGENPEGGDPAETSNYREKGFKLRALRKDRMRFLTSMPRYVLTNPPGGAPGTMASQTGEDSSASFSGAECRSAPKEACIIGKAL